MILYKFNNSMTSTLNLISFEESTVPNISSTHPSKTEKAMDLKDHQVFKEKLFFQFFKVLTLLHRLNQALENLLHSFFQSYS